MAGMLTRLPALQLGNIGDSDITDPAIDCYYYDYQPANAGEASLQFLSCQSFLPLLSHLSRIAPMTWRDLNLLPHLG